MRIRVVNSIEEFKQHFGFSKNSTLLEADLDTIENPTDLYERKRRDAEVICCVAANCNGKFLDVGTSYGHSAFKLATNMEKGGTVYTVNLLPEQMDAGSRLVTHLLPKEEIGSFYRKRAVAGIEQIYANTLTWNVPPEVDGLSIAYIDGAHDTHAVLSDSRKFYERIREGGFIMWHDFSPLLRGQHGWIHEAMCGVERFLREHQIEDEIVNLRHSWVGVLKKRETRKTARIFPMPAASQLSRDADVKPFIVPSEMRRLRYLIGYIAHHAERMAEEEAHCAALRKLGYDVEGFCVSVPYPAIAWPFERLAAEWQRRSPPLMKMYEALEEKLRSKDVFVLWTGAMLHPEFVRGLSTYNVYVCSDDPESSELLSKPVARFFDHAFTRNIACVEMYREWGCERVKWLCPVSDLHDPSMTAQRVLTEPRRLGIAMFCERFSPSADRRDRIERLHRTFPEAIIRGAGWPGGYVTKPQMMKIYRNAKIGWNLHNSIGPTNTRLTALPAFGVLEICDNKRYLGRIFRLDWEVVGFDTIEECVEKTRYYLEHEDERREIAARGWRRVATDYTEQREWERILSSIAATCLQKLGVPGHP